MQDSRGSFINNIYPLNSNLSQISWAAHFYYSGGINKQIHNLCFCLCSLKSIYLTKPTV